MVISLNPVISHLNIVVSISIEHNRKSILSGPLRNDLESQVFPYLWSNGSNSLQSFQLFRYLLIYWWKARFNLWLALYDDLHFFFLIRIMMSVTVALRGWSFLFVCCVTNYCCLLLLHRPQFQSVLYRVYTWWRLLYGNYVFLSFLWTSIVPCLKDLVLFVGLRMKHCPRWTLQFLLVYNPNSIWYLIQRYNNSFYVLVMHL